MFAEVTEEVRTIFGRPFVKRFALCYQTVVCPVCLSCPVYDVGVLVDPWFRHHLNRTERDATATREAGVNFE